MQLGAPSLHANSDYDVSLSLTCTEQDLTPEFGGRWARPWSSRTGWAAAHYIFNGVAVGPSGAVYVTGDRTDVLYRFRRGKEDHD